MKQDLDGKSFRIPSSSAEDDNTTESIGSTGYSVRLDPSSVQTFTPILVNDLNQTSLRPNVNFDLCLSIEKDLNVPAPEANQIQPFVVRQHPPAPLDQALLQYRLDPFGSNRNLITKRRQPVVEEEVNQKANGDKKKAKIEGEKKKAKIQDGKTEEVKKDKTKGDKIIKTEDDNAEHATIEEGTTTNDVSKTKSKPKKKKSKNKAEK